MPAVWTCRFTSAEVDVAALAAQTGDNLEQAARHARYEFFGQFLTSGELDRIAVGHTRSDQAETVLFRFLRGSGTAGLAGIRPVTDDGIVRPLIEIDRADVELYLRERGHRVARGLHQSYPRISPATAYATNCCRNSPATGTRP